MDSRRGDGDAITLTALCGNPMAAPSGATDDHGDITVTVDDAKKFLHPSLITLIIEMDPYQLFFRTPHGGEKPKLDDVTQLAGVLALRPDQCIDEGEVKAVQLTEAVLAHTEGVLKEIDFGTVDCDRVEQLHQIGLLFALFRKFRNLAVIRLEVTQEPPFVLDDKLREAVEKCLQTVEKFWKRDQDCSVNIRAITKTTVALEITKNMGNTEDPQAKRHCAAAEASQTAAPADV